MMKRCFEKLWKARRAVIFGAIICLSAGGAAFSQSSAQDPVPVLEGLDPVMLVQGKEVQGNVKITATRGQFQYVFASVENRTTFEKDPQRYEIQLDGACARMGPGVGGNPDLYTVFRGHIYIFGSADCLKIFNTAPEKFIEPEPTVITGVGPTPDALKKGQALIAKAVAALGGEEKVDGLKSYREQGILITTLPETKVENKTNLTVVFPNSIRREIIRQLGPITTVVTPVESFVSTNRSTNPMTPGARRELEKQVIKRTPLGILRARKSANFKAIASGMTKSGDLNLEQLVVELDGINLTLGIDPVTGRIHSLAYQGRGVNGAFGEIVESFADFRLVDGIWLPFKTDITWNGQANRTVALESISVNSEIDRALFEKPKQSQAQ
jgi:YHS domain-containing protein